MLAMTILVAVLFGGFSITVTVQYIKEWRKSNFFSIAQMIMPILSFAATITIMILECSKHIEITGSIAVVISIVLLIFGICFTNAEDNQNSYRKVNTLSIVAMYSNFSALSITLCAVAKWN